MATAKGTLVLIVVYKRKVCTHPKQEAKLENEHPNVNSVDTTMNSLLTSSGVSRPIAESSVDNVASTMADFFSCSYGDMNTGRAGRQWGTLA